MGKNQRNSVKACKINKVDEKRRRLVKGAAGAAPVMLSIAHRPVWAGSRCTYSGQLSGNLSAPEETCGGEGCSQGFFKTHPSLWHPDFPPEMFYGMAFGFGAGGGPFPGYTLYQVIKKAVDDADVVLPPGCSGSGCLNVVKQLGVQSVAALQNAATGVSYKYTVAEVIQMTRNALDSGDVGLIEDCKDEFDKENNKGCTL